MSIDKNKSTTKYEITIEAVFTKFKKNLISDISLLFQGITCVRKCGKFYLNIISIISYTINHTASIMSHFTYF